MTQINYEKLIGQWHLDRNLIEGSTDKDQYMKLIQEVGELSDSLCKSKDFRDDVGDIMVVLIIGSIASTWELGLLHPTGRCFNGLLAGMGPGHPICSKYPFPLPVWPPRAVEEFTTRGQRRQSP